MLAPAAELQSARLRSVWLKFEALVPLHVLQTSKGQRSVLPCKYLNAGHMSSSPYATALCVLDLLRR